MMATFRAEKCCRTPEVRGDDGADEQLEDQQELALLQQVGLAGLVDQLRDLPHRLVHRHVLELRVDHEAEGEPERADDQAGEQQRVTVDAEEASRCSGRAAPGSLRRRRGVRAHRAAPRPAASQLNAIAPSTSAANIHRVTVTLMGPSARTEVGPRTIEARPDVRASLWRVRRPATNGRL